MALDSYQQNLLSGWEDVYKKGQLTLWILLALKDAPRHMAEIKQFISDATNKTLTADDKSMYRALRRYVQAEMITFATEANATGPERKQYRLAATGEAVLSAFCERNITNIFYQQRIRALIED